MFYMPKLLLHFMKQCKSYRTNSLYYYVFTNVAVTIESSLMSLLVQVSYINWNQTEITAEGEHELSSRTIYLVTTYKITWMHHQC